jgi:hypothetical protein
MSDSASTKSVIAVGHIYTVLGRRDETLLAGWAHGAIYATSTERTAALDGWLRTYNHRRPHGALGHKPPIARLDLPRFGGHGVVRRRGPLMLTCIPSC